MFTTSRAPHVVGAGAATIVRVRTGTTGAARALATASSAPENFVDVADGSLFARNDDVVVDDGTPSEEYATIQLVDGNRLWFSSPSTPGYPVGLALPHAAGASVLAVTLATKTDGADYTLVPSTGTITEVAEFGAGAAVVVTYTTEFALPAVHPLALNASPDLDETSGKWTKKSLVPGTYTLTLTGFRNVFQSFRFELNVLRDTSKPATADLAGRPRRALRAITRRTATAATRHLVPRGPVPRFRDLHRLPRAGGSETYPGYRRGRACDDRRHRELRTPPPGPPRSSRTRPVPGRRVRPHAYLSNFEAANLKYRFPAMPGGTTRCAKCHGEENTAWLEPANRNHPTEQGSDVLVWRVVCAACHATARDFDHYADKTTGGVEGCAECHAPGSTVLPVDVAHKTR